MSINLIDPNEEILKLQSWFVRGDENNRIRIPDFEEIRSFVQLKMRPRKSGYFEVNNENVVNFKPDSGTGEIILSGFHTRKNPDGTFSNYYSTQYTDELMGNNGRNRDYEGFGIKSINIVYDANKIPVVTIVFYDLRGNVLSNIDSKFSQMFQLPYPVFELKIKGGFGPIVTYDLLKTRDDISIDEGGNFIITSKFVGNKFSPLSDVLLGYLKAVPYLDRTEINVNDTQINSYQELIISTKKLYTKLEAETQSTQELQNIRRLEEKKQKFETLKGIYDKLEKGKVNIKEQFDNSPTFQNATSVDKLSIQTNYIEQTTLSNNILTFNTIVGINVLIVNTVIGGYIDNLNTVIKSTLSITSDLITRELEIGIPNTRLIKKIDYTQLKAKIDTLQAEIISDSQTFASRLETNLQNLRTQILGSTRLTVGNVISIMLKDYNKLLTKINDVATQAKEDTTRTGQTNVRDGIPFPTVVKKDSSGANNIVFPGVITQFQNWPEVKFVNDFIDSYFSAVKESYLSEIQNETNEDGSSKYIPFNPREVYKVNNTTTQPPNVYFGKTSPEEIAKLMVERFYILTQVSMPLYLDPNDSLSWNFGGGNDSSFFSGWFTNLFGSSDIDDTDVQKNIYLTNAQFEARNIAFAIASEENLKNWFKTDVKPNITNLNYFNLNPNSPLTKNKKIANASTGTSIQDIAKFDKNYITFTDIEPTLFNSSSNDVITKYIEEIKNTLNGQAEFTKDNILYFKDTKLEQGNKESDYDTSDPAFNLKQKLNSTNKLDQIYNGNIESFKFDVLADRIKINSLIEVPKGMIIFLGAFLYTEESANPSGGPLGIWKIKNFNIVKDSEFYKYLKQTWNNFKNNFGYQVTFNVGSSVYIINQQGSDKTKAEYELVLDELYKKTFISINDYRASAKNYTPNYPPPITWSLLNNDNVYLHYLQLIVPKIVELSDEITTNVNNRLRALEGSLKDDDIKLSVYKCMQVIYENYLHDVNDSRYIMDIGKEFKFVDRAYNDISQRCVVDMKTLLNDNDDANVSMLSAISRLLSDNNFWFYPFQGFLTTTQNYNSLFDINYDKNVTTNPLFLAMYVGGVSSNPSTARNSLIDDDGIKQNDIPADFGTGLNAFLVELTGRQNQMVFSNFQHSTESLKNTDEGLRIQSDIINNASNHSSIGKGQSLLNVYQKQSYTSTITIPYGNMGIQPTQYYYEKFIPIFEGLYIIYNVEHSIDSDTQRLQTVFKGYRLKKDTNPIVESEVVDFIRNNAYRRISSSVGGSSATGAMISTPASPTTGRIVLFNSSGTRITKYWEAEKHHSGRYTRTHSTLGGPPWEVVHSSSRSIGFFRNEQKYTQILQKNTNRDHIVADIILKVRGNTNVGIPAPFDGKVVYLGFTQTEGNSIMCIIDTTGLKTATFLHWENPQKSVGQTFSKGEILAIQASVGRSTSAHLHIQDMLIEDYVEYLDFILTLSRSYDGRNVLY